MQRRCLGRRWAPGDLSVLVDNDEIHVRRPITFGANLRLRLFMRAGFFMRGEDGWCMGFIMLGAVSYSKPEVADIQMNHQMGHAERGCSRSMSTGNRSHL